MRFLATPAAAPWLVTLGLFLGWEAYCRVTGISPFILPAPSAIFEALWRFRAGIWLNAEQTLLTTLAGFGFAVVFGLFLGVAIGASAWLYAAIYPLLVAFNAIPKVAIVPVLVIWVGIGTVPAIITAFLISFFPIVVNVATGVATVEPELLDVLRSLGAKRRDIMLKVAIPRSLPYFFASLKIAITLAFVGSVISETVAANRGIGFLMLRDASANVPRMFAALLLIAALAVAMYGVAALIERRFTRWATRGAQAYATGG
ncbi:ABC transporter permease [Elioraea tepidiphila]|jgi:NitT/TauT family transport system permease protein|uniref:ABC transporter permease n=1 Tax=Elioraea tepidiphila TaxID=457934 RepID=UPI0003819318|nr:ABC transporter permease [Elioraea tepidiphila]